MTSRKSWAGTALVLFTLSGCAAERAAQAPTPPPPAAAPADAAVGAPQTEEQKTFYALGSTLGRQIQVFNMSPEDLAYMQAGLSAEVLGKEPAVDVRSYGPLIVELARNRSEARAAEAKKKSQPFLEAAAQEPGAVRTESGLIYKDLTVGSGASPTASDTVTVHYRGTLPDGKEFDSSYTRNEPAQFPLDGVIKCWTEGVAKMKVGGKAKLVCPSDLAYGDRGTPGIPGGSALVFEVELVDVRKAPPPEPPPAPEPAPKPKRLPPAPPKPKP
ncbi:FKBP-type peptidyl-prolyl cis-trans isomerase [Archangium primigenium]|uniref:FKBP-type peptidyl-prolyl cis-trans isomerase n=1 Tax=[Archangium] primigenium TaxID=2792470 RepID=UPI00195ABC5A|nr:FKBP-type peptidyl-prolyl cis-trans isomerase [Archangium primigenium]MBM7112315.1 FKBP-type peptidyl-prolyl cis-trans isomerase [Archangium primigenium]